MYIVTLPISRFACKEVWYLSHGRDDLMSCKQVVTASLLTLGNRVNGPQRYMPCVTVGVARHRTLTAQWNYNYSTSN